jgi:hypothetical protein
MSDQRVDYTNGIAAGYPDRSERLEYFRTHRLVGVVEQQLGVAEDRRERTSKVVGNRAVKTIALFDRAASLRAARLQFARERCQLAVDAGFTIVMASRGLLSAERGENLMQRRCGDFILLVFEQFLAGADQTRTPIRSDDDKVIETHGASDETWVAGMADAANLELPHLDRRGRPNRRDERTRLARAPGSAAAANASPGANRCSRLNKSRMRFRTMPAPSQTITIAAARGS